MPGADTLHVAIEGKSFGDGAVLGGIAFAAQPGEVLALLAPSGAGKTTTLRIVLGLDHDFAGRVARPAGRIGAMFQDPRLLPWLDVAGNLLLVAPALTGTGIGALLEVAGLQDVARLMPAQLSLGMARRVALARALAVRPSLLVLDEPFASLDPSMAAGLARNIAAHARAEGAIVLLATHDLDQALAIADRILILSGTRPAALAADLPAAGADAGQIRSQFPFLVA